MRRAARGAALGLGIDAIFGEPPDALHPLRAYGAVMGAVERVVYRDAVGPGALYAALGLGLGALAGWAVRAVAPATALAVGGRALDAAARDVGAAVAAGDLSRARALVPALVGRDPSSLDGPGLVRAAIESVAENAVDAIVAPALAAVVLGAPGALGYRALNTLDAMVGHTNARYAHFGTPSARLDDVANWVPARVTAALVALVRPRSARAVARAVRVQAPAHPSPNAGVAEAAFAAALGVRLGGPTVYAGVTEARPVLGCGRVPTLEDLAAARRLCRDVTIALAALLVALWVGGRR